MNIGDIGKFFGRLRQYPLRTTVYLVLLISLTIIIYVFSGYFSELGRSLFSKKEKNDNDIKITSYNQSGGITAYNVELNSRHKISFNEEIKKELDRNLANDKNKEILVLYEAKGSEAINLAKQIRDYLKLKGYKIKGFGQAISNNPQKGIGIIDQPDGSIDLIIGILE